jgi:hypothetical protein
MPLLPLLQNLSRQPLRFTGAPTFGKTRFGRQILSRGNVIVNPVWTAFSVGGYGNVTIACREMNLSRG